MNGLPGNFLVLLVIERKHATKKQVHNDPQAPKVYFFAVRLLQQDLGCDITQGAEGVQTTFVGPNDFGKPEVYDFEVGVVVVGNHEHIFGLEVSVGDSEGMKVVEGGGNLMGKVLGPLLGNFKISFFEVGEQVSAAEILHYNIDVVLVFEYVEQTDDVGVLAHFKDLDLTSLQFYVLNGHFLFAHDLNGDALATFFVDSGLNEAKLAFAEGLLDVVEVEEV